MVMAAFYESSNRHIGTPYIDKVGKGQPLTVCNGLTGKDVIAGKWYSPAECFRLEKKRYVQYEQTAKRSLTYWGSYNPFQQATFYDFLHNKGDGNFQTSTMRRDANAGNWVKACRENVRWNKGTVHGVSTVLPGLKIRGDANAEVCEWGLSWRG
ncbi:lysozyme [Comamonas thiooxydans]|uniref:lysozyme n=1 Tax=Comamonas thiooxydans TaxID=363952 RepID=UPI000695EAF3|nr:glycoside hydrolase family protein [Comamonas thiooxydans]CUB02050.1 Phage-related lysozyme (muramidase), GH24 family [Comamonas thiooxydans]